MEKHMAVCPYCGAGCKMNLVVENGQVIDAEGLPGITNEGELCLKGMYGYDFVNDTKILTPRIYHPMIRRTKGAPLERVTWDEALDFTAERLRAIIEEHGAESVMLTGSSRGAGNEANYVMQKFTRACLGTNNIDNCARTCHAASVIGLMEVVGSGAMSVSIPTLEETDCILLFGYNPAASHPIVARRIVNGDVPESMRNKRIVSLNIGSMLAGAKYRGEFEERLKSFLKEVTESNGEIILFIDELHTIVGAGASEGAVDASNLLKPALARGELRTIGATTLDEYRKYIEKDAALERRFQPVMVAEPSVEDTIAILRGLKERYEVHHGVRITDAAIVAAATLSDRYISDRFLPDKAADLVDEAAARLKIELDSMPSEIDQIERETMQLEMERQALAKEEDADSKARLEKITKELADLKEKSGSMIAQWKSEKAALDAVRVEQEKIEALKIESERAKRMGDLTRASEITYGELPEAERALAEGKEKLNKMQKADGGLLKEEVTEADIAKVVATWTGIPAARLQEGERAKLVHMEERLGARVIGQKQAVKAVSDAVRRARAGL